MANKETKKEVIEKKNDKSSSSSSFKSSEKSSSPKSSFVKDGKDSSSTFKNKETSKDLSSKTEEKTSDTRRPFTNRSNNSEGTPPRFQGGQNRMYNNARGGNRYYKRRKFCKLCAKGIEHVDYKDVDTLNKYLNHSLKIAPRKLTGACSSHQRKISNAIKRARIVALIPFVKE